MGKGLLHSANLSTGYIGPTRIRLKQIPDAMGSELFGSPAPDLHRVRGVRNDDQPGLRFSLKPRGFIPPMNALASAPLPSCTPHSRHVESTLTVPSSTWCQRGFSVPSTCLAAEQARAIAQGAFAQPWRIGRLGDWKNGGDEKWCQMSPFAIGSL